MALCTYNCFKKNSLKSLYIKMHPKKWVMFMYMSLLAKVVEDYPIFLVAKVNFELFCVI